MKISSFPASGKALPEPTVLSNSDPVSIRPENNPSAPELAVASGRSDSYSTEPVHTPADYVSQQRESTYLRPISSMTSHSPVPSLRQSWVNKTPSSASWSQPQGTKVRTRRWRLSSIPSLPSRTMIRNESDQRIGTRAPVPRIQWSEASDIVTQAPRSSYNQATNRDPSTSRRASRGSAELSVFCDEADRVSEASIHLMDMRIPERLGSKSPMPAISKPWTSVRHSRASSSISTLSLRMITHRPMYRNDSQFLAGDALQSILAEASSAYLSKYSSRMSMVKPQESFHELTVSRKATNVLGMPKSLASTSKSDISDPMVQPWTVSAASG